MNERESILRSREEGIGNGRKRESGFMERG